MTRVQLFLAAGVALPFIYFANLFGFGWLTPGFDQASQMPSELGIAGLPFAGLVDPSNVGWWVRGLGLVAFSSIAYLSWIVMRRVRD